ncbi:hypothetical protein PV325_002117 [Microctonus aethiopoides]|nr:hypothetical protein PV325_002117 [Microctonus aethiopoides]
MTTIGASTTSGRNLLLRQSHEIRREEEVESTWNSLKERGHLVAGYNIKERVRARWNYVLTGSFVKSGWIIGFCEWLTLDSELTQRQETCWTSNWTVDLKRGCDEQFSSWFPSQTH